MEKQNTTPILVFGILSLLLKTVLGNYLVNGDFQSPAINPARKITYTSVDGWYGFFQIGGPAFNLVMGDSQFLDLGVQSNGQIHQIVTLPKNGTYVLRFNEMAPNTTYDSFISEIFWNGKKIGEATPKNTSVVTAYITFDAKAETGELSFIEVGIDDVYGVFLDDVCLENVLEGACGITFLQQKYTLNIGSMNEKFKLTISHSMTLPYNQMKGLKHLGLFIDDLWLYFYDRRDYNGTMLIVLQTGNHIEDIKWSLFNYASKLNLKSTIIPTSDISRFSNQKHMEVDNVDDSFFRGLFNFMIFSVPQTILLCIVCKRIFSCLFNYRISILFRRFYFIECSIIQALLESNFSFFTYLFFKQMSVPFFFNFTDKVFLAGTVLLFFCMVIIACCFYFILNKYHGKGFGYFIYYYYRCFPAFVAISLKYFCRGFLKGCIHGLFYYDYQTEIILLSVLEVAILIVLVIIEKRSQIFITKTMFCLTLLYHLVFILINISLYLQQQAKEQTFFQLWSLALYFQTALIYFEVGVVSLTMMIEFVPNDCMNPVRIEELEGQIDEIEIKGRQNQENKEMDENQYRVPKKQRMPSNKKQEKLSKNNGEKMKKKQKQNKLEAFKRVINNFFMNAKEKKKKSTCRA